MNDRDIKYLELLAKNYPNVHATAAEIVRLQAILELPKTTEHFMSDIHGEYSYFTHILKNASGAIHSKIDDSFGDLLGEEEKNALALLLYYPERAHRFLVPGHHPPAGGGMPPGHGQVHPGENAHPAAA